MQHLKSLTEIKHKEVIIAIWKVPASKYDKHVTDQRC